MTMLQDTELTIQLALYVPRGMNLSLSPTLKGLRKTVTQPSFQKRTSGLLTMDCHIAS